MYLFISHIDVLSLFYRFISFADISNFQSCIVAVHRFTPWKISAAKCYHKTGVNVPVTASSIHRDPSSLKAFMKRQIVADSVLPAYSMFSEARIVVLDETVYLRQRGALLGWAKDGISNYFYVRERRRISPFPLLLFLVLIVTLPSLVILWYEKTCAAVFALPSLFYPLHVHFSRTWSSWENVLSWIVLQNRLYWMMLCGVLHTVY